MTKRVASFQLMELIEQELAFSAEADLAAADEPSEKTAEADKKSPDEETPWRGIEDQMKNPMRRRRR